MKNETALPGPLKEETNMFDGTLTTTNRDRDPLFNFVDRFFNDGSFNGLSNRPTELTPTNRTWLPPVDIVETEESFVATADLPGLTKEDIDISLENNLLTVSGERRYEKSTDGDEGKFRRVERAYGSFRRSFNLPTGVDVQKVQAQFEHGVLILTMPKAEVAKSRKIAIA
jgi:HSP20 family protein